MQILIRPATAPYETAIAAIIMYVIVFLVRTDNPKVYQLFKLLFISVSKDLYNDLYQNQYLCAS